jgi:hypothetical protein
MDSRSAPQRVGEAHFTDQSANFERHLWSAAVRSRLPSPEQAKTSAMSSDDCLRLYDHQGIQNAWRDPIEAGKNETIEIAKGEPLWRFSSHHFSSHHIELVAQRHDLPQARLVIGTAR